MAFHPAPLPTVFMACALAFLSAPAGHAEYLTPIGVTTPDATEDNAVVENIINHNGLNNAGLHTDAFNVQNHWRAKAGPDGSLSLTFDLGARFDLSKVRIWNYNEAGGTDRGVKDIVVSFSNDNVNFTDSQPLTVGEAPGRSDYEGEDHELDPGAGCRYVKFDIASSHGSSGGYTGLSEVRFFTTTDRYTPISASANQLDGGRQWVPENLINESGMTGFNNEQSEAFVYMGPASAWRQRIESGNLADQSILTFDLGAVEKIGAIKIWNYHEQDAVRGGLNQRGVQEFSIYSSDDDVNYTEVGTFTLKEQLPRPLSVQHGVIDLNGQDVEAQYIQFRIKTNFEGNAEGSFYGLSEVRFYGPASDSPGSR
jgi:hypothetical protein